MHVSVLGAMTNANNARLDTSDVDILKVLGDLMQRNVADHSATDLCHCDFANLLGQVPWGFDRAYASRNMWERWMARREALEQAFYGIAYHAVKQAAEVTSTSVDS